MTQNETLVPLDLSDAIALIERQREQIAALKTTFKCFHCGFVATTKAEAEAHFGEGEGFPALCVEWTTMDDTERGQAYQELRMDLDQTRSDETKLEEQIASLQERERVLIRHLQTHGDIETDKEEALRGGEEQ